MFDNTLTGKFVKCVNALRPENLSICIEIMQCFRNGYIFLPLYVTCDEKEMVVDECGPVKKRLNHS